MDYRTAFEISAAGMSVERLRMDVTALNLANMHVTASSTAGLYRPLRVVTRPQVQDFEQAWVQALPQATVQAVDAAPRMVHEPGHPHADSKGMVAYPGIDHTGEMLNMMTALRAYEANVMAANASRAMAARALEIGG
jgi:flagellar basal-body rod protein FlgC